MHRDKNLTRRKILDALEQILMREQCSKIGINAIAKEAGVDKVMVYRYFGSMDKLLIAFAEDREIWPALELLLKKREETDSKTDLHDLMAVYLVNYLAELRRDQMLKDIQRWAMVNKNALTQSIESDREKQAKNLLNQLPFNQNANPNFDIGSIIALLHAGITYLVLCAKNSDYYLGVDLKSARGWKKIENAINELISSYGQFTLSSNQAKNDIN